MANSGRMATSQGCKVSRNFGQMQSFLKHSKRFKHSSIKAGKFKIVKNAIKGVGTTQETKIHSLALNGFRLISKSFEYSVSVTAIPDCDD